MDISSVPNCPLRGCVPERDRLELFLCPLFGPFLNSEFQVPDITLVLYSVTLTRKFSGNGAADHVGELN